MSKPINKETSTGAKPTLLTAYYTAYYLTFFSIYWLNLFTRHPPGTFSNPIWLWHHGCSHTSLLFYRAQRKNKFVLSLILGIAGVTLKHQMWQESRPDVNQQLHPWANHVCNACVCFFFTPPWNSITSFNTKKLILSKVWLGIFLLKRDKSLRKGSI